MTRTEKEGSCLWVWEGSLVHDVLPLIEGVAFRGHRPIGRNSTITFVEDPRGNIPKKNFTFGPQGHVQHLPRSDAGSDLFRFSDTRIVRQGRRKVVERYGVDIFVAKDRTKAWLTSEF